MKNALFLLCLVLILSAAPLHAQEGCASSPENPTAILAVLGSASGIFVSVRTRIKARKK
jgi:XrtJ-associated TM-motif-TM protein